MVSVSREKVLLTGMLNVNLTAAMSRWADFHASIRGEWLHRLSRPRHTSWPWVSTLLSRSPSTASRVRQHHHMSENNLSLANAHGICISFSVVVTARSVEKGQAIVGSVDEPLRSDVSFAVVEDVARDGAFDHVCPFRSCAHAALPSLMTLTSNPPRSSNPGRTLTMSSTRPLRTASRLMTPSKTFSIPPSKAPPAFSSPSRLMDRR